MCGAVLSVGEQNGGKWSPPERSESSINTGMPPSGKVGSKVWHGIRPTKYGRQRSCSAGSRSWSALTRDGTWLRKIKATWTRVLWNGPSSKPSRIASGWRSNILRWLSPPLPPRQHIRDHIFLLSRVFPCPHIVAQHTCPPISSLSFLLQPRKAFPPSSLSLSMPIWSSFYWYATYSFIGRRKELFFRRAKKRKETKKGVDFKKGKIIKSPYLVITSLCVCVCILWL